MKGMFTKTYKIVVLLALAFCLISMTGCDCPGPSDGQGGLHDELLK